MDNRTSYLSTVVVSVDRLGQIASQHNDADQQHDSAEGVQNNQENNTGSRCARRARDGISASTGLVTMGATFYGLQSSDRGGPHWSDH